ncbi:MAG: hypothetical protein ACRDJG_08775 [Actinomycetota bacterium]
MTKLRPDPGPAPVQGPLIDPDHRRRQLPGLPVCLGETSLRDPMRAGASDAEIEHLVAEAVWSKRAGHKIDHPEFVRPARSMSMIGG